jgi:dTDP-4-amino-4,6-dideoxygalactose transaminase
MKKVKFVDLSKQYAILKPEIDKKLLQVVKSQGFILDKEVLQFERKFAKYCGAKYALGLGSGTDALYLSLVINKLEPEDEVIVPVFTFIAPAEVTTLLGGKVVFCDVDPETGLIDPNDVGKRITKKTRCIIPVHLYGQIAPVYEIKKIIGSLDIQIIEDAAQAHGALYHKKASPINTIATYSFFPAKNLGAYGDAGAIVTNEKSYYEDALLIRNHGQEFGKKYFHKKIGSNLRMDEIQAAVLNVKLKYLDKWNKKRRKLARIYDFEFSKVEEIEPLKKLANNTHVYHQYVIRTKRREALQNFLKRNAIETRVHYPLPLHLQPAYNHLALKKGEYPNAEILAKEVLCLPIYPELEKRQVLYIASKIKSFFVKN